MSAPETTQDRHRLYEDALALATGTMLVALGLAFYAKATLVVGGTAGLSLLLQYATGYGFGTIFFLVNLPFYWFSIRRMGWAYTARTFVAVAMVSVLSRLTTDWISIQAIEPLYAAACGGVLVGIGLLALFRHRAGLGGFNILAVFLQDTYGWRAGYVQLGLDVAILVGAAFVLPVEKLALSLVGAAAINLTLAINHKPGRYMGMS
jgi:uncharacterized membrane-anchored protein YitT (DUF2179 family)